MEALGRILAEDAVATFDNPPFDRSPLDGYTFAASGTKGAQKEAPASFRIIGEECAGDFFAQEVPEGAAVRLMTGAAIPKAVTASCARRTSRCRMAASSCRTSSAITRTTALRVRTSARGHGLSSGARSSRRRTSACSQVLASARSRSAAVRASQSRARATSSCCRASRCAPARSTTAISTYSRAGCGSSASSRKCSASCRTTPQRRLLSLQAGGRKSTSS